MEWQDLVGRTIVAVAATRAGVPVQTVPNVLQLLSWLCGWHGITGN